VKNKPTVSADKMAVFLWDDFLLRVTGPTCIWRAIEQTALQSLWATEMEAHALRVTYLDRVAALDASQLVFVDESGANERMGFRRSTWSPLGVDAQSLTQLDRAERFQVLLAYTLQGVALDRVISPGEQADAFGRFIEDLLPLCEKRRGQDNRVLIMDGALLASSAGIREMFAEGGVQILCLPPAFTCTEPRRTTHCSVASPVEARMAQIQRVGPGL
jgi:hypothetical protein